MPGWRDQIHRPHREVGLAGAASLQPGGEESAGFVAADRASPFACQVAVGAGAKEVRAAARGFRRSVFGLAPIGRQESGTASRTGQQITEGAGVQLTVDTQADTLSRVLSGEKFPTWELTEKLAIALGADSEALRKVWSDERQRNRAHCRTSRPQSPNLAPGQASSLPAALRTLHQRAACPTPYSLAVATAHAVSPDDIRKILHGEMRGTWEQVAALIRAMDGEPSFFHPHWEETHQSAAATPPPTETATHRLNRILTTFGDTHHDSRTLTPSPSLTVRRRALRRRLAQAAVTRSPLS